MVEEDVYITVGGVEYLLVLNAEVNTTDEIITDAFQKFLKDADYQSEEVTLVLVYTDNAGQVIKGQDLVDFRINILQKDDVFQPPSTAMSSFMGARTRAFFLKGDPTVTVPPGPYVFMRGKTWQPWRTYYNTHACFMSSFKPSPHDRGKLVVVDAPIAGLDGRVVVPSRCYYKPSASRPLHGARIAVNDNIDIAGHKTSLCNRAWMDLYPPKTKHAACVQTMIDAGAVIVGKVKLQAMIMREEPLECVEFTAPFNPRADGYQVPSGSSHASAASIGAYDWLGFTFGSDTNGSGRKPASYNGCFSIRPSTGITDNDGQFDMPVFFGRSISRFPDFISTWYGTSPMLRPGSVRILYPSDYLPTPNPAQTELIDKLVSGLEQAVSVERTEISLAEQWKRDTPDGPEHADIAVYLERAGIYPFYHDQYHNSMGFKEKYKEKCGKPPFVHRALHWQWGVGKAISQHERDECWRRSEVYRHWLLEKVFDADSSATVTVMPLPIEAGQPNYRDAELPPYSLFSGYAALNMSPMSRAPEVTAPGTDLILVDLVERALKASGIPTEVKTGRFIH
ncbi:amidase [Rhypophila sp. PSN 637]